MHVPAQTSKTLHYAMEIYIRLGFKFFYFDRNNAILSTSFLVVRETMSLIGEYKNVNSGF